MRKINKINTLATVFATAIQPQKYNSTNFEFYYDVYFSLLYCQEGLCAYTEKRLLFKTQEEIEQVFENGEYSYKIEDKKIKFTEVFGDLEHFNQTLKETQPWAWDNLFVVYSAVNQNIKRIEEPKFRKKCLKEKWNFTETMLLLKPDLHDYQWDKYLEYNSADHIFVAKIDLEEDLAEKIESVLKVLGINCEPIRQERIAKIETWLSLIKKGENPVPNEFPTAFEFCLQILNKKSNS